MSKASEELLDLEEILMQSLPRDNFNNILIDYVNDKKEAIEHRKGIYDRWNESMAPREKCKVAIDVCVEYLQKFCNIKYLGSYAEKSYCPTCGRRRL